MCKEFYGEHFYTSLEWLGDDPWKSKTTSEFCLCACCSGQGGQRKDTNHKNGLNFVGRFNSLYKHSMRQRFSVVCAAVLGASKPQNSELGY